jgi:hypothetical protein
MALARSRAGEAGEEEHMHVNLQVIPVDDRHLLAACNRRIAATTTEPRKGIPHEFVASRRRFLRSWSKMLVFMQYEIIGGY